MGRLPRRGFMGGMVGATVVAATGCKASEDKDSSTGETGDTGETGSTGASGATGGSGSTGGAGEGGTSGSGASSTEGGTTDSGTGSSEGTTGGVNAPVIDTHMHVWSDDAQTYPFPHPYDPSFDEPTQDATVEMLIDDMDANGCTHAVLVQVIYHGWDNSYVADCVARYPDRFKVHGLIDPADPGVDDQLEYWMSQRGLHGMRFSPIYYDAGQNGGDAWLDDPQAHTLWGRAEQLGAVFNFFIAPSQLARLGTMAAAHPGVPVVIDHIGRVDLEDASAEADFLEVLALASVPNCHVKIAELNNVSNDQPYPFEDTWPYVTRVAESFGVDRLVWGTGFPGAARPVFGRPTLEEEIALIRDLIPGFSDEERAKILGRNAERIWGFG